MKHRNHETRNGRHPAGAPTRLLRLGTMLALGLAQACVFAADAPLHGLGVQVLSAVPTSPDLKLTTGGPGLGLGAHWDWRGSSSLLIRGRVDALVFPVGHQQLATQGFDQRIDSRISTLGAGVDLLLPIPGATPALTMGLALQKTRWKVEGRNTLSVSGGASSMVEGPASWWRFAYGPVVGLRVSSCLSLEGRLTFSHHGMEGQPARFLAMGLLWHF